MRLQNRIYKWFAVVKVPVLFQGGDKLADGGFGIFFHGAVADDAAHFDHPRQQDQDNRDHHDNFDDGERPAGPARSYYPLVPQFIGSFRSW